VIAHVDADLAGMHAWLGAPASAALMILFVAAAFYHGQLGTQVVIEDYVHHEGLKVAGIVLVKFLAAILGLISIIAVLKLAAAG